MCAAISKDASPKVSYANRSQSTLQAQGLEPITTYRVQVIALLTLKSNGALTLRGSQTVTVTTDEGGKVNLNPLTTSVNLWVI